MATKPTTKKKTSTTIPMFVRVDARTRSAIAKLATSYRMSTNAIFTRIVEDAIADGWTPAQSLARVAGK